MTVHRLALRTVCALTVALEETNTAEKGLESMLIGKTEIFRYEFENCSALSTSTDVDQVHRQAAISSALPVPRELKLEQPFFFLFSFFFFFFFEVSPEKSKKKIVR